MTTHVQDVTRPAGESHVAGWSLLLPPGWWHIPLDQRQHRRIRTMVDRLLATLPRDQVFPWRRDLTKLVIDYADRAEAQGGRDLYLLSDLRYGMPLAGTCLTTVVPVDLPQDVPAQALAEILSDGSGDEPGVLDVAGRECARIVRRRAGTHRNAGSSDVDSLEQATGLLPTVGLDVHIPFPDGGRTLLLSFGTPIEPLAEPMILLFEAIAGSLRWRWE